MKKSMVRVALATALVAGTVATASAYEAIDVTGGGSLTGTVKFAGTPPAAEKFPVTKDTQACGTEKTKPDLVVGADGALANAVVIVKASKGKKLEVPATPVTFDQKGGSGRNGCSARSSDRSKSPSRPMKQPTSAS